MQQLVEIIKVYSNKTYLDEDGNCLNIILSVGVSIDKLNEFEQTHDIVLPSELKELLLFSNGVNLFGIELLTFEAMQFFPEEKILFFHNWGNGDFDGINQDGEIYFSCHSIETLMPVSSSLSNWIISVVTEIELKGTLLHPLDYSNKENKDGMYRMLLADLN